MRKPYTTRGNKDLQLSLAETEIGWKRQNGDDVSSLKNLALDLPELTENFQWTRSDVSVPTPWAALVSFDLLLNRNGADFGALRTKAVTEWRALLTLIALRDIFELRTLNRFEIDLTNDENEFDQMFYNNLLELAPKKSIFNNRQCWEKFDFMTLDNINIGVFSNLTLVAPNYKYSNDSATSKLQRLDLMDEKLNFKDPIELFANDRSLSLYMVSWLECLKNVIATTDLSRPIGEFIDDINECFAGDNTYNDLRENKYMTFDVIGGLTNNVYELLWNIKLTKLDLTIPQIQDAIEVKGVSSDVIVLESLGKNVVKIINKMGDSCERPTGQLIDTDSAFLNTITLVEILDGFDKAYTDAFNYCQIEEIDDDGDSVQKKYGYILPIDQNVLKMLSVNDINEIASIEKFEDRIEVSMKLRVKNGDVCILKKAYYANEWKKINNAEIPMVAVWPYAEVLKNGKNIWKDYYVYSARNKIYDEYDVVVSSATQQEELKYVLQSRINKNNPIERKVASTDSIPTYMYIIRKEYDNNHTETGRQPVGAIVFPTPHRIVGQTDETVTYVVGLDFGTTSTTAFCRRDGDIDTKEKFVKFGKTVIKKDDDKSVNLSEECDFSTDEYIGNNESGMRVLYNNYLVGHENEPELSFITDEYPLAKSYLSWYKVNVDDINSISVNNKPLIYGNIIFDKTMLSCVQDEEKGLLKDLKWGKDGNTQKNLSAYLSQFMKQVVYAIVKSSDTSNVTIKWRFSYPTALTERALENYEESLKDIVSNVQKATGIDSVLDIKPFYSESITSAKFRLGTKDYMCIDIGGGSSDVSYWKQNLTGNEMDNVMQFSIGIASRKIFLAGLTDTILDPQRMNKEENYQINNLQKQIINKLRLIFPENAEKRFEKIKQVIVDETRLDNASDAITEFSYLIEALLQTSGDSIRRAVKDDAAYWDKLEKFIILGLWGVLYYCAMSMTKYKNELENTRGFDVYFAGTGSMMWDWLSEKKQNRIEDAFTTAVNFFLGRGDEHKIKANIVFKKTDLKTETARGLLRVNPNDDNINGNRYIVCGANCKVNYGNAEPEIIKDSDSIYDKKNFLSFFEKEDTDVKSVNPISIKDDLSLYAKLLNDIIYMNEDGFELDLNTLDEYELLERFDKALSSNRDRRTIAPPFILEIEALLRTILGY